MQAHICRKIFQKRTWGPRIFIGYRIPCTILIIYLYDCILNDVCSFYQMGFRQFSLVRKETTISQVTCLQAFHYIFDFLCRWNVPFLVSSFPFFIFESFFHFFILLHSLFRSSLLTSLQFPCLSHLLFFLFSFLSFISPPPSLSLSPFFVLS